MAKCPWRRQKQRHYVCIKCLFLEDGVVWCLGGCPTQPTKQEAENRCGSGLPDRPAPPCASQSTQGLLSTLERESENWDCSCPGRPPMSPCVICSTSHSAPPCRAPIRVKTDTRVCEHTLVWKALFSLAASAGSRRNFHICLLPNLPLSPTPTRTPSLPYSFLRDSSLPGHSGEGQLASALP